MKLPTPLIVQQEPEQEQPIDYHIPKRRGENEDEDEERKCREQRKSHCSKATSKPMISLRGIVGKLPIITSAAAGHGRSSNGAQGGGSQSSGGSSGGGSSISFSGGASGGGGCSIGGGGSGGGGGGGMNPGRDGKQNYGPSSPPTGSLPPFYESLKGGSNGSGNYNGNFTGNNYLLNNQHNMECETGQELANLSINGGHSPPKQYSTLQNAAYGIVMKDEGDLEIYETKIDQINNLFNGSYPGYEDSMMVEMPNAIADSLQFTATLAFSSSAEQALLESLSDANELSSYLQRLPSDDNDSDEIINNEITSESPQLPPVEQIESFQEHIINRNYENQRGYPPQFLKMYQDQLPSYQSSVNGESLHVHMQQQQQQMLSPPLSFNSSALDLDSATTTSLPSPGARSCSLDGVSHNNDTNSNSPPANVSGRRDSESSDTSSLQGRINVLKQRVSSKLIQARIKVMLS